MSRAPQIQGGLLPLRDSEIVQCSAFCAADFFILITNILSSDLFYSFNASHEPTASQTLARNTPEAIPGRLDGFVISWLFIK
jgi:hypothetical protein